MTADPIDFGNYRMRHVRATYREFRESVEALHDGYRNRGDATHDRPFDVCTFDFCGAMRRLEDQAEEGGWA